jgi:hypothetical protein
VYERAVLFESRRKRIDRRQAMHSRSASGPQLFHNWRAIVFHLGLRAALVVSLTTIGTVGSASAQAPSTHRVFLRDGHALPSYGDSAQVGDRIIFNLAIGAADGLALQLVSLPVAVVDLERTLAYAESIRAAFYAATRGEADYAAFTAALAREITGLAGEESPVRRLEAVERARERLLAWPASHYDYRAADVRDLAALFDDVVNDLRASEGRSSLSIELSSGPPPVVREPLLGAPSRTESIDLAVAGAKAAHN